MTAILIPTMTMSDYDDFEENYEESRPSKKFGRGKKKKTQKDDDDDFSIDFIDL